MERGRQRKRGRTYLHRLWKRATIGKPTGIKGTEVTPAPVINHVSFPRTPVGTHQCTLESLKERMTEGMTMIGTGNKGVLMVTMLHHHNCSNLPAYTFVALSSRFSHPEILISQPPELSLRPNVNSMLGTSLDPGTLPTNIDPLHNNPT